MKANHALILVALGVLAGVVAATPLSAEEKAVCPAEVGQAGAMVAKAQDVIKAGTKGNTQLARTPTGDPASGQGAAPGGNVIAGGRTLQGEPASGVGRTPQGDPASGAGRGLATSSASEISPWSPSPTDKTLKARTAKARKLTAQARSLCRAAKPDEAKAKAAEAIAVLDPK